MERKKVRGKENKMLTGKPELKKIQDFIFISDSLVDRAKTDIEKWFNSGDVVIRQPLEGEKISYIHCRPLTSRIFTKCIGFVPKFLSKENNINIDWDTAAANLDLMTQVARHCIVSIDGISDLEHEFAGEKILTMASIDALAEIFKEIIQLKGQNMQVSLPMWIGGLLLNNFFRATEAKK